MPDAASTATIMAISVHGIDDEGGADGGLGAPGLGLGLGLGDGEGVGEEVGGAET